MEAALIGASGRTTLGTTTLSIGRRADNALVIQDAKASSRHAEIRPMGEGYAIVDMGSTNGTYVNEQRLAPNMPQQLNANDIIRIGDTRFTYEASTYAATVFEAPPNNPAYSPTVMAAPPAAQPDFNAAPSYPPYEQNAPYGATMAAPPSYTSYQGGQVPPPPAYDAQSPYQQQPQYYPPYGQAPGPAARPSAASLTTRFQNDKRFRLYVIGAGAAILLLIIGFVVVRGASSPTGTLTQYCNDFKAGDFSSAYDLLSSNLQTNFSRADYVSIEQRLFNPVGGVTNCSVTNVSESDPSATGTIVYTLGNGGTATGQYTLVDQSGAWKISNESIR